jgi:hypothetical protein
MALLAKDEGAVFQKPDTGMHDAICVFVVDVGTHVVTGQFGSKAKHQIVVCFEIDQLIKDGEYA